MCADALTIEKRLPSDPAELKRILRSEIRQARNSRSPHSHRDSGLRLADVALSIPELQTAKVVALYAARATEPQTQPLLSSLHKQGKDVLLPVLSDSLQRCWAHYQGAADLQERSPMRPPEPSGTPLPAKSLQDADFIIVPALAVDSTGTRLGQGGGWYDRTLKEAKEGTLKFVFVYPEEFYKEEDFHLPVEDHDQQIDGVITTKGWHLLGV